MPLTPRTIQQAVEGNGNSFPDREGRHGRKSPRPWRGRPTAGRRWTYRGPPARRFRDARALFPTAVHPSIRGHVPQVVPSCRHRVRRRRDVLLVGRLIEGHTARRPGGSDVDVDHDVMNARRSRTRSILRLAGYVSIAMTFVMSISLFLLGARLAATALAILGVLSVLLRHVASKQESASATDETHQRDG